MSDLEAQERPTGGVWIAFAGLVLGLLGGVFATLLVEAVGSAFGSPVSHPTPAVSLIADLAFDLAFVGAALYLTVLRGLIGGRPGLAGVRGGDGSRARGRGASARAQFGYRTVSWKTGIAAVVIAGIAYYLISAGYAALVSIHGTDKLPSELGVTRSTAAKIGAALFVCVVAPMAEEFFFRGFLFGALSRMRIVIAGRSLGPWVAAVIVGLLFGLAHSGSAAAEYLVPLGILGFILCLVRWRTGSLYPCMALHSLNNSVALGVNELHWRAGPIVLLAVAALAVIAALTGPLAVRSGDPETQGAALAGADPS